MHARFLTGGTVHLHTFTYSRLAVYHVLCVVIYTVEPPPLLYLFKLLVLRKTSHMRLCVLLSARVPLNQRQMWTFWQPTPPPLFLFLSLCLSPAKTLHHMSLPPPPPPRATLHADARGKTD